MAQSLTQTRLRELLVEVETGIEDIVGSTRDRMDALLDAVLSVSAGLDLDETLRRIIQAAMDLVDARYGALGVLDQGGMLSRFVPVGINDATREMIGPLPTGHGCVGAGAERLTGRRIPVRGSTTGAVFADRTPRSVPHLAFDVAAGLGVELGPALALPLGSDEPITGVLVTARAAGSPTFIDDELQLVASFADQAALALQRAETQTTRRELDVLADRDRIARDLHDHVIQQLFGVGLALNGIHRRVKQPDLAHRLSTQIDDLDQVIRDIRTVIYDLHTEPGDQPHLRNELNNIITELTGDIGLRTIVRMSGPLDSVPAGLAQHAHAVIREGISNTIRHANARDLTVTVSMDDQLIITITDDGDGIPELTARSGLHNLTQRAHQAGGACHITRPDTGGTRLTWNAPLARAGDTDDPGADR